MIYNYKKAKINKVIVTTTINPPTKATLEFVKMTDWHMIIIGDKKTPHEEYFKLQNDYKNLSYLTPEDQDKKYPALSEALGWNKIQRRTIGFVEAYTRGYEIIASIDDDNIPYDNWGKEIFIGKETEVDMYSCNNGVFDPLSVTNHNYLWHRGYPLQLTKTKNEVTYLGRKKVVPLVQANLWDGDPDIDAVQRIALQPLVKLNITKPYATTQFAPFNSQNTFLHKSVLKYYIMLPYVGRMDDIWPSYIVQNHFPNSVIYNKATVYQERNEQDLLVNMQNEIFGYRNTIKLLNDPSNYKQLFPEDTLKAFNEYTKLFEV